MAEYVDLVRQGPRSLKYELSRLVALVTVYGEGMVLDACQECLKAGIVGVDNLELYLKRRHHPSKTNLRPEPITFTSEKLNRVHGAVDLRKYDALLFEVENKSASEEKENGTNEDATGGTFRAEAEVLGTVSDGGLQSNEGPGERTHLEIPHSVDNERKIGETNTDDPNEDQKCEVPSSSDGGEL
jgi:hypothetical protein